MEEKPLIQSVREAIYTLYHDSDCHKKTEANQWLINFQKSLEAWRIADELLQTDSDIDYRYFAAQMMRNKIMLSFHELPQDKILSLHSTLMQRLSEISKDTENIIITQLCVAVVDLSLQMIAWSNPIYSFINKCEEIPPLILLEILRVFPEEMDTKLIRLGSNRRREIQDELNNCAGLLNNYLKQVLTRNSSPEILLKALYCFYSWISVIKNISVVIDNVLMPKVFQILTEPPDEMYERSTNIQSKLHDAATDLLCCVLRSLHDREAAYLLNSNLLSKIAAFENAYHTTVARESEEKSINYCRIFSELGEIFLSSMVEETKVGNPHFSIQALDLILMCAGHHDYEVCCITFNFWFNFAEMLFRLDDDSSLVEFKPYINRLFIALGRQVQMESDHEGLLEDSDDFKTFREKVCDLVRDVVFVIGSTNTFCQIFLSMQNSNSLTWDQIEANLFIMYAVAWKIDAHENDIIPKVVESIINLPESTHIAVKYTAILILGELREWFNEHPNYLIIVLEFLARNLQHNNLAEAAASSMYAICFMAKRKLRDQFSPLLNILKNLHNYSMSNKSAISVIKSVTAVMFHLSPDDVTIATKEICRLQIFPLQNLMQNQASSATIKSNTPMDPAFWLDRLAAIFRFIEQCDIEDSNLKLGIRNSCAIAFAEIKDVLFEVMNRFQSNVIVMERCCRCIRFAIRALGKIGVFMLPELVEKLVTLYRANGHSCFLYLGSVVVDEHGQESSNWELILRMVDAFIEPSFALLRNQNNFRDHPDTIDDLFRLCSRILQRLPIVFLRSPSVWPLLECGLAAISLDHREANSSVMKFFYEIFDCDNGEDRSYAVIKRETVRQIYEKHGETLVHNLIHASVFQLPSSTLSDVAEVLYNLIQFDCQTTLKWMALAIDRLPNQTSSGGLMASPSQIQIFLQTCEQAKRVRDVSKSLREFTLYYA